MSEHDPAPEQFEDRITNRLIGMTQFIGNIALAPAIGFEVRALYERITDTGHPNQAMIAGGVWLVVSIGMNSVSNGLREMRDLSSSR